MMQNVAAHKRVGVKVGQGKSNPNEWDGHTLESLSALQPKEQALLTLHIEQLTTKESESDSKHESRVKSRYGRDTINILLSAEKHWRSEVGLVTTGLSRTGTIYNGFMRFKDAFDWRMTYNKVAVKVAAAKVAATSTTEPADDGLMSERSTSSNTKSNKLKAAAALKGCI